MSAAMIEIYDAQMLDYHHDHDFSMQVSSSDTWLQDEAVMEDDGQTENANIGIEVDMDPYEGEPNPEYEMEDGSVTLESHSIELEDVEVYDASRAHSPNIFNGHPLHDGNLIDPVHHLPEVSEPMALPYSSMTESHNFDVSVSESTTPAATSSTVQLTESHSDNFEPSHAAIDETAATPPGPEDQSEVLTQEPAALRSEETPPEVREELAAPSYVTVDGSDSAPSTVSATESDVAHNDTLAHLEGQSEIHEPLSGQGEPQPELESSAVSTGDPHEISEGVYIDPPPAVLLSLSTEIPPVCLFNVPSRSGLNTPRGNPNTLSGDTLEHDYVVLLGHLPTLYYEPLSSVFEALREEEYLNSIPNLRNGELLLDAYDLELVVSEVCII